MIQSLYKTLNQFYGPQGWWPTTPHNKMEPQYKPGKSLTKNSEAHMFEICLGAILTQNTNWNNVVRVLTGLKKKNLLSYEKLMEAPDASCERYFKSSGYFRQKTKRIKNFLEDIDKHANGSFKKYFKGSVSSVRKKLLELNGIGPETADSMLLYAAGKPIFVVDAYTKRIGSRWGIIRKNDSYDGIQKKFMNALPTSTALFGQYHALIVELAKHHCRTQPICQGCPVKKQCRYGRRK